MFRRCLAAALLLTAISTFAQDKAPSEPLIDVKTYGRPKNFETAKGPRYSIWHDQEGWHIRTKTSNMGEFHVFQGVIEVVGGKFTKVLNFDNFETSPKTPKGKKKPPLPDRGSATERQISFRLRTAVKGDGFEFRVSPNATALRFRLLIDGEAFPEKIFIGERAQPAPSSTFELPANPSQ